MFALLWAIVHSNPVDTVYSELELGHQLLYVKCDANRGSKLVLQSSIDI